jgi:hypothetical protein
MDYIEWKLWLAGGIVLAAFIGGLMGWLPTERGEEEQSEK